MALAKGTNSYVTVEEADAYFEDRLDVAAWTAADEPTKAQALVTATSILDNLDWIGAAVSESQALAFPRVGQYFDPRLGTYIMLSGSPVRLTKAVCEQAYHLLNNDGLLDDTGEVDTLSVGSISLNTIKAPNKLSSVVTRLINPLLINGGRNIWWRAN